MKIILLIVALSIASCAPSPEKQITEIATQMFAAFNSIKFTLPICAVLTFQNGKIVRDATYYDNQ